MGLIVLFWIIVCLSYKLILKKIKNQEKLQSMIGVADMLLVVQYSVFFKDYIDQEALQQWLILSVVLLSCNVVSYISRQYTIERENARLKSEQTAFIKREYQTLQETYSVNARLFHDFHNHMEVLYAYLINHESEKALQYLEKLKEPKTKIIEQRWFFNQALDYLMNSKIIQAQEADIKVKVQIEYPPNINIKESDLTGILGNLMDNGMEANLEVTVEQRFLNLTIRRINQMLVIKMENAAIQAPKKKDDGYETKKENLGLHGWGLKSIQKTAENYDGTLELSYDHGVVRTVVILPFILLERKEAV